MVKFASENYYSLKKKNNVSILLEYSVRKIITSIIDFQPRMMNHSFRDCKVKFQSVIKHFSSNKYASDLLF